MRNLYMSLLGKNFSKHLILRLLICKARNQYWPLMNVCMPMFKLTLASLFFPLPTKNIWNDLVKNDLVKSPS